MEIRCSSCKRTFQFETDNETFWEEGGNYNTHCINCPFCEVPIVIKTYAG